MRPSIRSNLLAVNFAPKNDLSVTTENLKSCFRTMRENMLLYLCIKFLDFLEIYTKNWISKNSNLNYQFLSFKTKFHSLEKYH